ncbi:MAG: guanylate kinase [Patescibacteria group bacterium]|nr:guanylate kinase [Patescibacteria group bacterium]
MKLNIKSKIFLISGSAGAGKDSVLKILKRNTDLYCVITTTNRKPRKTERQGNPYYFISGEEYAELIKKNGFLEYENVYSNYYFGVTKQEIEKAFKTGKPIIWQIDYRGLRNIIKMFPNQVVSIFILPPSLKIARQRMNKRQGDSSTIIEERLELAKKEIVASKEYDYTVVNKENKLAETIAEVLQIINQETGKNLKFIK